MAVLQGWMGSSMLPYFTLPYVPPVKQQWRNFYNTESSSATYVNEKADVLNKSYLCCYHRRKISSCHQLSLHSSLWPTREKSNHPIHTRKALQLLTGYFNLQLHMTWCGYELHSASAGEASLSRLRAALSHGAPHGTTLIVQTSPLALFFLGKRQKTTPQNPLQQQDWVQDR